MASSSDQPERRMASRRLLAALFRSLASLKLGVILLVVLAVVLACTTVAEAFRGSEYVRWYVYNARWFVALLALLALNILGAALIRLPWKKRHVGFLTAHVGVLVLLSGAFLTFSRGIEGQLPFTEGDTADKIVIRDRSVLTAVLQRGDGRVSNEFAFSPGPVDWPEGETLDFGQSEGIGLRVLAFYRHAREEVNWVADEAGLGPPAIQFTFDGPGGRTVSEQWLVGTRFGGAAAVGPAKFQLFATPVASMLEDFLTPPFEDAGKNGVLSIYHDDHVERVDVKENLGKKVPVAESKISVEIAEYLPNAAPAHAGRFVSRGTEPGNPVLELLVHLPDDDKPLRQITFARYPFLNLDGVHGQTSPVKFWYHHPAVEPEPGAQFLQTPDGKLYCRVGSGGKYVSRGGVGENDRVEISAGFSISILRHVAHARREVGFHRVQPTPGETANQEAAALVELAVDGEKVELWMQRDDRQQAIRTPKRLLLLRFGYDRLPLGFSLKLLDFERGMNPGRAGDASFASSVRLADPTRNVDEKHVISMNQPLSYDKFTFYQSRFQELGGGLEASILSVSHDPGRFWKYLGSMVTCVGIFIVFYLRRRPSGEGSSSGSKKQADAKGGPRSGDNQRRLERQSEADDA